MLVRTVIGVLLVGVLIACLYLGDVVFLAVIGVLSILAVHEMDLLFRTLGKRVFMVPAYLFTALFGIVYRYTGFSAMYLFAFALLMFVATIIGQVLYTRGSFESVPYCLVPFAYPILSFCCIEVLYFGLPKHYAITACALAIAAPAACDTLAYFCGTLFGKHKLCPDISPKKTVEGFACGLVGSTLLGWLVHAIQHWWQGTVKLLPLLVLGFLCGAIGQFGDLFASCLKRGAGRKDFSSLLPGHGGVLDRLDSTLLCAPAVLACFLIVAAVRPYVQTW